MKFPKLFSRKKSATIEDAWNILRGMDDASFITSTRASRLGTVLACVRVVSESMGMLPVKLFDEDDVSLKPVTDHASYRVLSRRPNSWMIPFEFRQAMTACAMLNGVAYAYKVRDSQRNVRELLPLLPSRVSAKMAENWEPYYELMLDNNTKKIVSGDDLYILRGLTIDNQFLAWDVVREAATSIGLALSTEKMMETLAKNGGRPQALITPEHPLTEAQAKALRDLWNSEYTGAFNSGKTAVLSMPMKYQELTQSAADGQVLETRKFSVEDICRHFGVYPQIIGYSDKASTYASAEAFFGAHVQQTLMPWAVRWEQCSARDLLSQADRDEGLYFKMSLQGLLRASSEARAAFYQSGILNGWMTRNEVRSLEELPPLKGLDEPLQPLNMAGALDPALPVS